MLIGNVGKDPDVRYYDADQAVAQFPLATTERGYTLQNGTKVTSSMSKGASATAAMMTQKGSGAMSLKFLLRTWNCSIPSLQSERRMHNTQLHNPQLRSLPPYNRKMRSRSHRQPLRQLPMMKFCHSKF